MKYDLLIFNYYLILRFIINIVFCYFEIYYACNFKCIRNAKYFCVFLFYNLN